MARRAPLFVLIYLVIYQLWIWFGSASYLSKLQAERGKLTGNSAYNFVKELFEIEDETIETDSSNRYANLIQIGVRYLETSNLWRLSEDMEKILAKHFFKNVVNVLLHLHYEACQELKLPSPALEKWEGRASVRDADHLEFVQELFGLEDINNKYYEQRIAKLVQKTVAYLRLETQGKGKMTENLENAKKELIKSLESLYSCKLHRNCKLAMFAVYQALISDSTREGTNSTTSEHPLAQSNEDNPIIDNFSTGQDHYIQPALKLAVETESNQSANIVPCRKSSRLEKFIKGKDIPGDVGKREFAISFFHINPEFRSTKARPYDRLIEMSIKYFEAGKLKALKLGLERMIGRPFSKSITRTILDLHCEACQELKLSSSTLEKWEGRKSVGNVAHLEFVQELFGLERVKDNRYKKRVENLVCQTLVYLGLEAQCKGNMNKDLEEAKKGLISSLKSLYDCDLSKISKLAMFAVYRALSSDSTKEGTNSTTSEHPLAQSNEDNPIIDNFSTGQDHYIQPALKLAVETESNQSANIVPCRKSSRLEKFNKGHDGPGKEGKREFAINFFGIKPEFHSTDDCPYDRLIEMSIKYFEAGELKALKLGLERMIGKSFSKSITRTILDLHYEACQELKLSSSTLEKWEGRKSVGDAAHLEFVQELFKLGRIKGKIYKEEVENLVDLTVEYLELEAQCKGNMTKSLKRAKEHLISSLRLLCNCKLAKKSRFAMFLVYRALSSDPTNGNYPQASILNPKVNYVQSSLQNATFPDETLLSQQTNSLFPNLGYFTWPGSNPMQFPADIGQHTYLSPELQTGELHNLVDPSSSYGTQTFSFPSSLSLPIYNPDDEEILTFLNGPSPSKEAMSVASILEYFDISSDPASVVDPIVPSLDGSARHNPNEYQPPAGIEPPSLFPTFKGNSNASNMPLNTAIQNTSTSVEDLAEQEFSTLFYGPQSPEGLPVADPEPISAPSNTPHSSTTSEQGQHWIDCELVDMNEYKFFEQREEIERIESDPVWNEMLGWI